MNPKKKNIKRREKELRYCEPPAKAVLSPPQDKAIRGPCDPCSKVKDKMIRIKKTKKR